MASFIAFAHITPRSIERAGEKQNRLGRIDRRWQGPMSSANLLLAGEQSRRRMQDRTENENPATHLPRDSPWVGMRAAKKTIHATWGVAAPLRVCADECRTHVCLKASWTEQLSLLENSCA